MNEQKDSFDNTPRIYPAVGTVAVVMAVSVVATLLSASVVFMLLATALSAWLVASLKRPVLSVAVPLVSFGIMWLLFGNIPDALISSLSVYIIGVICAICTVKRVRLWKSTVFCALGFALYFGAAFVYLLYVSEEGYMADGSIINGAAAWWNDKTAAFADYFFAALENVNMETEITRSMLDELMAQITVLLPGVIAAVFAFLGAAVFLLSYLAHKIFKTDFRFFSLYSRQIDWSVDFFVSVFFILSTVMAAIFSAFKNTEVVQFAFINICIVMFIPMLANGIYTLIVKLKAPRPVIIAPDGTPVPRAPKTLILWLIIPMTVISPLMGMLFVAFYGAIEQINNRIVTSLRERQNKKQ